MRAAITALLATTAAASPMTYVRGGEPATGLLRDDEVQGVCDDGVKSLSGYFHVEGASNLNYFFWMFESREDPGNAPTAVWLTGGPGCSSQLALFTENGPCSVDVDGQSTSRRESSWNTRANILWVDQPAGVGFSYGDKADYAHDEAAIADDMYAFLDAFMTAHPDYAKNGLFLFGESYAGHYVPAIASRVVEGMRADASSVVQLSGMGVGNGLTMPSEQYKWYPAQAVNNTKGIQCVTDEALVSMEAAMPRCIELIEKCQENTAACGFAQTYCNAKLMTPYQASGLNVYDLTKECEVAGLCYDFSRVDTFLNLDWVREALHVAPEAGVWADCNYGVNGDFKKDWMKDFDGAVANVLSADIPVLLYAGDLDYSVNYQGVKGFALAFEWPGKKDFNAAKDEVWAVSGLGDKGLLRTSGRLQFLQLFDAGHLAPMDQPEASLAMFDSFLTNLRVEASAVISAVE